MTSVTFDGLVFELRRSARRRTVSITVGRDGSLSLSTPEKIALDDLKTIVDRKKAWIFSKLSQKEPLLKEKPEKEYVSGESFYYLGRRYMLRVVDCPSDQNGLILQRENFLLCRSRQEEGRELFMLWYTGQLRPVLERYLARLAPRVPVDYHSVRVQDLGFKWGTRGKKNDLYFHWRTAMLPDKALEYVVTHELVHLVEPRHNAEFWDRMETIIPDCGERVRWLAENGSAYDL